MTPDTPDPVVSFEDEDLDSAWADDKAREVARVVRASLAGEQLAGLVRPGRVQCRSTRCQFELEASAAEPLRQAMDVLGDDRGLVGFAKQMFMSNLTPTTVTVTLSFRREPPDTDSPGSGN